MLSQRPQRNGSSSAAHSSVLIPATNGSGPSAALLTQPQTVYGTAKETSDTINWSEVDTALQEMADTPMLSEFFDAYRENLTKAPESRKEALERLYDQITSCKCLSAKTHHYIQLLIAFIGAITAPYGAAKGSEFLDAPEHVALGFGIAAYFMAAATNFLASNTIKNQAAAGIHPKYNFWFKLSSVIAAACSACFAWAAPAKLKSLATGEALDPTVTYLIVLGMGAAFFNFLSSCNVGNSAFVSAYDALQRLKHHPRLGSLGKFIMGTLVLLPNLLISVPYVMSAADGVAGAANHVGRFMEKMACFVATCSVPDPTSFAAWRWGTAAGVTPANFFSLTTYTSGDTYNVFDWILRYFSGKSSPRSNSYRNSERLGETFVTPDARNAGISLFFYLIAIFCACTYFMAFSGFLMGTFAEFDALSFYTKALAVFDGGITWGVKMVPQMVHSLDSISQHTPLKKYNSNPERYSATYAKMRALADLLKNLATSGLGQYNKLVLRQEKFALMWDETQKKCLFLMEKPDGYNLFAVRENRGYCKRYARYELSELLCFLFDAKTIEDTMKMSSWVTSYPNKFRTSAVINRSTTQVVLNGGEIIQVAAEAKYDHTHEIMLVLSLASPAPGSSSPVDLNSVNSEPTPPSKVVWDHAAIRASYADSAKAAQEMNAAAANPLPSQALPDEVAYANDWCQRVFNQFNWDDMMTLKTIAAQAVGNLAYLPTLVDKINAIDLNNYHGYSLTYEEVHHIKAWIKNMDTTKEEIFGLLAKLPDARYKGARRMPQQPFPVDDDIV